LPAKHSDGWKGQQQTRVECSSLHRDGPPPAPLYLFLRNDELIESIQITVGLV